MPEPEPELQATANLSPVSPAPVHTAPALAVPALQDTVDTIDAMVAAALAPNGAAAADEPVVDPELAPTGDEDDDVVDDDSFNDAYAEENQATDPAPATAHAAQQEDAADDYAKEFDSPVGSERGDGEDDVPPASASQHPPSQLALEGGPAAVAEPASRDSGHVGHLSEPSSTTAGSDGKTESAIATSPSVPDAVSQGGKSGAAPAINSESDVAFDTAADIKQLVADLTTPSNETGPPSERIATQPPTVPAAPSTISSALPSPSSLPPRPPIPHATPSYPEQHHPGQTTATVAGAQIGQAAHASPYHAAAVGGVPGGGLVAPGVSQVPPSYQAQAPGYPAERSQDEYQRKWDQFLADERQYMTEANWDRFPEGSRIFIGNLSSDKVSKRDVFDMFHKFGRLAQISLKSAYGFVQYHSVEEGKAAVDNLEGVEIKGRRIHLEISRVQDKSKKDRGRSPDKGRGRDRDGRRGDRYSSGRDEYRSGREPSPRQSDHRGRDDQYGRSRGSLDSGRNRRRSRSPGYGRHDKDSYRRRSPSPYGRTRGDSDLDLPKRYGDDVPDVQIILGPDVHRDFANWVEMTFKGKGLRTKVMFLHPRMPKDQVIQRQAAEGVHAVVDLDLRAQSLSKIPVQAFDRSAGLNNVRFEQYVDLDPSTAAEVILRAKASGTARYGQQQSYGGYGQGYGQQQQQQQPAGPGYGTPAAPSYPQQPAQPPASSAADIAALMGQVDPATLQKLIATIQAPQAGPPVAAAAPANGGLDIQAILSSLGGQAAVPQMPPSQGQYGAPYNSQAHAPPQQQAPPQGSAPTNGDSAAQVQNIMAQLARYR